MKLTMHSSIELGSDRAAAAGCITGVLRRILCKSVRQRRYRDDDEEVGTRSERFKRDQGMSKVASSSCASPGIVARLMGLESSAIFPCAQPEMISRTRSASSAEARHGPGPFCEERRSNGGSQLRKSQSLREIPSYLRKESEEFLVLTFGEYDEGEASELSAKKIGLCFKPFETKEGREHGQVTEKKRLRNKILENDAKGCVSPLEKEFSGSGKGMVPNDMVVKSASCRKKQSLAQRDMEMECSSQNSSPVSVFDLPIHADSEYLVTHNSSISVCKASMWKPEEEESRNKSSSVVEDDAKKTRNGHLVALDFSDLWASICRIGGNDLINSNWIPKKLANSEEAVELGFVIGHEILDRLLHEAVFDLFV